MIVTEYMENGALDRYLRVSWSNPWRTRYWTAIMAVLRFFFSSGHSWYYSQKFHTAIFFSSHINTKINAAEVIARTTSDLKHNS